ncbi:MAG TPA: phosphate/phosphite/phosphonate ABC transporter substrate-binding protein [Geminicoccaceae bacterium]|nr:phosphate/phosphite/phosphonate ABC transporter substrate-binding protein [Geminicoccaceae bacterium]
MKFDRRLVIAAAAAGLVALAGGAHADWRDEVPVFRIGILGGDLKDRQLRAFACLKERTERALRVPVELRTWPDYTGVTAGLLSGELQAAGLGAGDYVAIFLQDPDAIEPLVTTQQEDGTLGYRSVLVVRADSPYRSLADLRGRSVMFTERLSASGFLVPYYELTKEGYRPDRFFGRLGFSGSHPSAVAAVLNGQADAAVTWSSGVGDHAEGYSRGNLRRMVERGALDMNDVRILWTSDLIPAGPHVVRKDLPDEAKEIYRDVLLDLADRDRRCFERIIGDRAVDFATISHEEYEGLIDIRRNGGRANGS